MSTVRYFRHDDAGAPVLNGQVGSLTNLLRKCLVGISGVAYGAQSSAGWAELFVGAAANIAAFSNASGSGCCVRVNDNAAGTGGAAESIIAVSVTMSDINTAVSATPDVYFRKSNTADNVARQWLLVADEDTAWLYCINDGFGAAHSRPASLAGFGYIDAIQGENTYRYFSLGRHVQAASGGARMTQLSLYGSLGTPPPGFYVGPATGIGAGIAGRLSGVPLQNDIAPYCFGGSMHNTPAATIHGSPVVADCLVTSMDGLLGKLRGLAVPADNLGAYADGSLLPDSSHVVVGVNFQDYSADSHVAKVLIDTAGPWS